MTAIATADFRHAAALAINSKRPLLVSHAKPDGDALGSLVALRGMLQAKGVSATAMVYEDVPPRFSALTRSRPFVAYKKDLQPPDLDRFDAVIVLDTCTYNQLEPIAEWLRSTSIPKLAIDHHRTRDDLADAYLIDESAAANCLILFDWAASVGWPIDRETAEALFVGIATDTGWFRHSNTDGRVLAAAADLVGHGANAHALFDSLYMCDTESRVRLLGAAVASMELHAAGKLAIMTLPSSVFSQTGATYSDTEDIVNEPLRIASVIASVLLVEQEGSVIRASLRSKAPAGGVLNLDVAAIAQEFGGGGHERAAGAKFKGPIEDARNRIRDRIVATLDES